MYLERALGGCLGRAALRHHPCRRPKSSPLHTCAATPLERDLMRALLGISLEHRNAGLCPKAGTALDTCNAWTGLVTFLDVVVEPLRRRRRCGPCCGSAAWATSALEVSLAFRMRFHLSAAQQHVGAANVSLESRNTRLRPKAGTAEACQPGARVFGAPLKSGTAVQAQKVRALLRERGLGSVRVGTVDDYQGQEERIIFISTVSPLHPNCEQTAFANRTAHSRMPSQGMQSPH